MRSLSPPHTCMHTWRICVIVDLVHYVHRDFRENGLWSRLVAAILTSSCNRVLALLHGGPYERGYGGDLFGHSGKIELSTKEEYIISVAFIFG